VFVPGQSRIPRTARLLPYPLAEQDSLVWVFIGDPARADASQIPRAPYPDSPDYTTVAGMEPLAARFSLLVDNLLDLSHETYLHGGYIGTPEVAATPITTEVDEQAGIIYVSRHMDDAECPPFYAKSTGLQGRIARWQDIECTPPCLYKLHSRIAPAGSAPHPDGTDPDAFHVEVVYAITPETEHSTHDFWAVARDFVLGDEGVSEFLAKTTGRSSCRTSRRSTCSSRSSRPNPRAIRSCRSTSTPAGSPPGGCSSASSVRGRLLRPRHERRWPQPSHAAG